MREKITLEFYWTNPPDPDPVKRQGVIYLKTQSGHVYERKISGRSFLNPSEAAKVLDVSRMHIHKLVKQGFLKAQKRHGIFQIRLVDLIHYNESKRPPGRPRKNERVFLVG